jgi:phosphoserine aminotransferase
VPADYKIGIVPASDTGAVEMAMWSMLGARPATMIAWESFGAGWVTDVVKQLKLDAEVKTAEYGEIVDLAQVDFDTDVVFTWNGTTSGVRVPNGDAIPADRAGLTICDATSAAFAQDLPWDKLDVTTFSWQKVLGGEAAHGMLILSPRAVERLESYTPAWPLPKIFRLTKGGKLIEGIFVGETINTPSMLAVEDYLLGARLGAGDWRAAGADRAGRPPMRRRCSISAPRATGSTTSRRIRRRGRTPSVCLKFTDARITDGAASPRRWPSGWRPKAWRWTSAPTATRLRVLRIWCGATVETSDIEAMLPWLDWAFHAEIEAQAEAA